MPIRDFTDAGGITWQVWATTPMRGEVRPQFASGWLAFESGAERRRLVPIPTEWEDVEEVRLCELLAQATPITRGAALQPIDTDYFEEMIIPSLNQDLPHVGQIMAEGATGFGVQFDEQHRRIG